MNKLTRVLGIGILVMASLCTVGAAPNTVIKGGTTVNLIINEVPITDGALPIIVNDRTLAPLRVVSETLGAKVDYLASTQKVTVTKGEDVIEMHIGKPQVKVNGETQVLDAPPMIKDGWTMLPIRFIGESLNCKVDWDPVTRTVMIDSGDREENTATDKWGRKVRTTNLPKNASKFPYIIEGVPNWVYEAVRFDKPVPQWEVDNPAYLVDKYPAELHKSDTMDIPLFSEILQRDLEMRLNIDYRTIDEELFSEFMYKYYAPDSSTKNLKDHAKGYVKYIKDNKIITTAEVHVLPETFWQGAYNDYRLNAYVKFTVVQGATSGNPVKVFGTMNNNIGSLESQKVGTTYEGLVQFRTRYGSTQGSYDFVLDYNTADVMCQLLPDRNLFGGAKPSNQLSPDLNRPGTKRIPIAEHVKRINYTLGIK